MSTFSAEPTSREERRRRTEACILQEARRLFAEEGFERATIRAVAERTGVDPALVMQYFGSKEGLFAAAMKGAHGGGTARTAPREEIPSAVLKDLLAKFEDTDDREAAVALLRNFLTHPEANRIMRDEVLCSLIRDLAADDRRRRRRAKGGTAHVLRVRGWPWHATCWSCPGWPAPAGPTSSGCCSRPCRRSSAEPD